MKRECVALKPFDMMGWVKAVDGSDVDDWPELCAVVECGNVTLGKLPRKDGSSGMKTWSDDTGFLGSLGVGE